MDSYKAQVPLQELQLLPYLLLRSLHYQPLFPKAQLPRLLAGEVGEFY